MRIFYVGNFTQKHCTEVHLANTLEMLGHTVVRFQENGYSKQELGEKLERTDCDMFLFTRTWGNTVQLAHLALLRERKIPSVSYHLDLYVGLTRKYLHGNQTLEQVFKSDPFWQTDFVFTPDGDPYSQEVFEANGVKHHYIKPGVYEPECSLTHAKTYKNEVLFVGGGDRIGSPHIYGHPEWNYRNELITWLYDTYPKQFKKFGHPQPTVRNDELNELYANSKIVVGDSVCLRGFTQSYYWSDRVYETIGRGGFMIHPYIKGLEEEFIDGETIVFYEYGNFGQLKEKIDYYLEHDNEREKIRKAGYELVKSKCTYTDRMKQMLDVVKQAEVNHPIASASSTTPIKINFGSGNDPLDGYCNVDMIQRDDVDLVHNLMDFPYPFLDNSASHIAVLDVLEHLDNYTDDKRPTIIAFLEECYRILQPNGELYIQVPSWDSEPFKIDVTHVRGFHKDSFDFLDPSTWYGEIRYFYTDAKFKIEKKQEFENGVMRFWMRKI